MGTNFEKVNDQILARSITKKFVKTHGLHREGCKNCDKIKSKYIVRQYRQNKGNKTSVETFCSPECVYEWEKICWQEIFRKEKHGNKRINRRSF